MRFEDPKLKAQQQKGSWMVGIICGPLIAALFLLGFFVPHLFGIQINVWLILVGSTALGAPLADRIGKRYKVMPQQFAGKVALCCTACLVLAVIMIYGLI